MKKPKKNIKPIKKDKNGFTLVELLAVIVVLALLILIAGRAVFAQIEKSRKNTFRTEVLTFGKAMDEYFGVATADNSDAGTRIVTIDSTEYEYLCSTIANLKVLGYIDYSSSKIYNGRIEVFRKTSSQDKDIYISIDDNKRYAYLNQKLSSIEKSNTDTSDMLVAYTSSLLNKDKSCPNASTNPVIKTENTPSVSTY